MPDVYDISNISDNSGISDVRSRAVGRELKNLVSLPDAGMVLEAFHGELLSNYTRWCR